MALREEHIPRGPYNITPIFVDHARGGLMRDVEGKEYIDFGGGIGCQNVGHCHPDVVAAVSEQAEKYLHTCFHLAMYQPYIELAKALNEVAPGAFPKKTYFVNCGAEAAENAVKIARSVKKRPAVIAFDNAYHGRTYMAMTLTSQVNPYKRGFGPFCPEVYRVPFAYCYRCPLGLEYPKCNVQCAGLLEELFVTGVSADSVAAVIVEPVQGEGGFIVPPTEYLGRIQTICEKYEILFIADEIQTGMGRTGKRFACEHFGLAPDILLTGKSIAAGLPLAGVTGRAEVMDIPEPGTLGGTFSGNPVACNAALAVLNLLDERMLESARRVGEKLRSGFHQLQERFEIIGDVRGLGAMVAMELVKDRESKEPDADAAGKIVRSCYEKGLVLLSCGVHRNVIRTLAPLVIADDMLERGLSILEEAFGELEA